MSILVQPYVPYPLVPIARSHTATQRLVTRGYRGTTIATGEIAFILPCHNEAADLPAALESIRAQEGATVDTILVVSDNSTDDTVAIARAAGVLVIETSGNRFKKAGALNLGIRYLMQSGSMPEYIITGDGDTEYDRHFVRRSLNIMKAVPRLGVLSAVCYGKDGLVAFPRWPQSLRQPRHAAPRSRGLQDVLMGMLMLFALTGQWLKAFVDYALVWMQRAEYSRAAILRLRQNIHTMSGAGSLIRAEAIIDVLLTQASPGDSIDWERATLYREHAANLVEDFALTLDVKKEGWKCTNNFYVVAHTDLMRDPRSLFRQRTRWVRGTIDELRRRKYSRESRVSALTIIYGLMMIPLFYVVNAFALLMIFGGNFSITDLWMFPLMGTYQAIMLRKMGWKSMCIGFILVPEMLYAVMRHLWIITSVSRSLSSTSQNWE